MAPTVAVAVTEIVHVVETPAQLPLQPIKFIPESGMAVSVTEVAELKEAEHVVPQSMPAGED